MARIRARGPYVSLADITYIRLRIEFVYLAVVLDASFPSRHRLGFRTNPGGRTGRNGLAHGVGDQKAAAWSSAPLRFAGASERSIMKQTGYRFGG
jgi:hypothetical protein